MYIPQDEQAALYDFFVYSQIFDHAERDEQPADHAEQKAAEREREKPSSFAAGDIRKRG